MFILYFCLRSYLIQEKKLILNENPTNSKRTNLQVKTNKLTSQNQITYNSKITTRQKQKIKKMRAKYLVGTLFEEEQIDQKQNIHNMKNKDPMGNTRWQGAFTGGFSAGFKNTCGSKQGWQPAHFVSSVSKRAQKKQQNIRDFMDKEDLGPQSITNNIELSANFVGNKTNPFNIVVQNSIGQSILTKFTKKKAVESVPETQQDLDHLLKYYEHQQIMEQSVQQSLFTMRDLQKPYSVGASELNVEDDEFIENYEELYKRVIRATVKQESEEQKQKRIEQNKIYFDFSKPIEQQPEYLREIHEIEDLEKPRKRKKNLLNMLRLKDIFASSIEYKEFLTQSVIDKAPQNYDPYHRIRDIKDYMQPEINHSPKEQTKSKHRIHSIQQRSDILGYQKLSNKFRSATVNSQPNHRHPTADPQVLKYFENQKKNIRYIDYVQELQGRKIACHHEYLSYEQAQKQREEFEVMYKTQKQIQSKAQKTSKITAGTRLPQQLEKILSAKRQQSEKSSILRTVTAWKPSQLLCKRFQCLLPYKIDQPKSNHHSGLQYF